MQMRMLGLARREMMHHAERCSILLRVQTLM